MNNDTPEENSFDSATEDESITVTPISIQSSIYENVKERVLRVQVTIYPGRPLGDVCIYPSDGSILRISYHLSEGRIEIAIYRRNSNQRLIHTETVSITEKVPSQPEEPISHESAITNFVMPQAVQYQGIGKREREDIINWTATQLGILTE